MLSTCQGSLFSIAVVKKITEELTNSDSIAHHERNEFVVQAVLNKQSTSSYTVLSFVEKDATASLHNQVEQRRPRSADAWVTYHNYVTANSQHSNTNIQNITTHRCLAIIMVKQHTFNQKVVSLTLTGNCLCTGKPSQYITDQQDQLSLSSLRDM